MSDRSGFLTGVVQTRTCPLCGHHEVGLATMEGGFYPLKPGMAVRVMRPSQIVDPVETPAGEGVRQEEEPEYVPWIPDPAQSHRELRWKYGVKVRLDRMEKSMTPEIYRAAYLDKLRALIEKEIYIPIPVLLDRFFTARHLAAGTPMQVAEAMWKELREVREPVRQVEEWLETREPSILTGETGIEGSNEGPANECPVHDALRELNELSLEEFLALL
jgi:hypothetical protein